MQSSETLWEKFTTYDNFLLAWQRTVNVTSCMIHDERGLKTFAYNLEANLKDLIRQVQAEDFPYKPLADHKVYVPKPSTTLRTMSLMAVPDIIVYQAFVNVIADRSHPYLVTHENQHVLGNLYAGSGKRWMLKPWKQQYRSFVNYIGRLYQAGNPWIASTDIVAFYDTIDHERLLFLIRKYCGEDLQFETLFQKCISTWSAHNTKATMSRGIPQGSNASDFLANLFLYEIDQEMIAQGYHYVRYVDDVRILGADKPTVQRGLILFDLELKCAGLVAQVTKTSVHQIEDMDKEVARLRFTITDPTGEGEYRLIEIPSPPKSEQAESVAEYVKRTPSEQIQAEAEISASLNIPGDSEEAFEEDDETENSSSSGNFDIDQGEPQNLQQQLREKFLEAFALLDDLDRGKEAESTVTFCLYRLEPHASIREEVLSLLYRLPWRSEAISSCLGRFKQDSDVAKGLKEFINEHDVYSWHRANSLWALYQVSRAKSTAPICRNWLADIKLDWYARMIAARILKEVPGQHAYLIECLQREQHSSNSDTEGTALLRQELAYSAFQQTKSLKKQLVLFRLICTDKSSLLQRLAVYLLQQPKCKVTWDDLTPYHCYMSKLSDLIKDLGLSADAPRHCFVYHTLSTMYEVSLARNDFHSLYSAHYPRAVEQLRESVSNYHKSPSAYVRTFHQFAHLTLIAFYEYKLPLESGLHDGYAALTDRKVFTTTLPNGVETWKELGSMRNRVDHPVDKKTKSHSKKITVEEAEFLRKKLQVALQEIFNVWLSSPLPTTSTSSTPSVISAS